jgi:hypothetical protein
MLSLLMQMKEKSHSAPSPDSECTLELAQYQRNQCTRQIAKLINKLSHPETPESSLAALNSQVNRLLKEKVSWSQKILDLGGRIPLGAGFKLEDELSLLDSGYRYFGRAKGLPEAQHEKAHQNAQTSRAQFYRNVSFDYWNFEGEDGDDDDQIELQGVEFEQLTLPTTEEVYQYMLQSKKNSLLKNLTGL